MVRWRKVGSLVGMVLSGQQCLVGGSRCVMMTGRCVRSSRPSCGFVGPLVSRRLIASSAVMKRAAAGAKGRPSLDDVERLSRGQAAKKRGTGSRAICHRLNEMERKEFELAKKMGYVQLRGTGYRRERKGSPLANIHRQLCDATARPCIEIHRGLGTDIVDTLVVDISPLRPRTQDDLQRPLEILRRVAVDRGIVIGDGEGETNGGGIVVDGGDGEGKGKEGGNDQEGQSEVVAKGEGSGADEGSAAEVKEGERQPGFVGGGVVGGAGAQQQGGMWEQVWAHFDEDAWSDRVIWELPVLPFVFNCGGGDRSLAKQIAQDIHAAFVAELGSSNVRRK